MQKLVTWSLLTALGLFIWSCGEDDDPRVDDNFDQKSFLVNIGTNLIVPAYAELKDRSDELYASIQAFVATPNPSNLEAARDALLEARMAFQYCAPYQFGPAEQLGLVADLNIFPTDKNRIESNILSGSYDLKLLSNNAAKGFPALGYLLYGSEKPDEEIGNDFLNDDRRAAYLLDVAETISTSAAAVFTAWDPSGGNYLAEFTSDGALGADAGSSLGILVNALNLSLERNTRDAKIGIPAGIRSLGIIIPEATEAYYGGYSKQLAVANLMTFKRLFLGENFNGERGTGFSDYLQARSSVSSNSNELSLEAAILVEFDASIASLQALEDPLSTSISIDPAPAQQAFAQLQKLSVLLKTDMASILGVVISYQDNDGD
ncbi:imelysin family protein [Imperialibacter roseus]|uniref:Imelysin family protein n=1 Tax=Imperialibacter roseus TaxID=1324217 RepID=A0ABZ0INB6_9BACT|nr:imelysin family protein [Imperialibacter roseus]WOK06012.1 imelysin family protein [Imperialibacter roseus]